MKERGREREGGRRSEGGRERKRKREERWKEEERERGKEKDKKGGGRERGREIYAYHTGKPISIPQVQWLTLPRTTGLQHLCTPSP